MAKAQETQDAELLALAALVAHGAALMQGQMQRYGEWMSAPDVGAVEALRAALVERGVLGAATEEA